MQAFFLTKSILHYMFIHSTSELQVSLGVLVWFCFSLLVVFFVVCSLVGFVCWLIFCVGFLVLWVF